ncbi:MAG: ABC transporter ATP-binding protein [archaeon]
MAGKRDAGTVLSATGISKSFRERKILSGVSFSAGRGELIGILGPSGGGKSTLVKILLGILKADSGKVERTGKIGYVPQADSFYPYLTVRENLEYFSALHGEKIPEKLFGLDPEKPAGELSGGQRKKLSILAGLAGGAEILLLDEPTVGLDPLSKRELLDLLRKLKKDEGKTILVVTHNLAEIEDFDKVLALFSGRSVEFISPEKLKRKHNAKTLEEVFEKIALGR